MISSGLKLFIKVIPDLVDGYYEERFIPALSLEEHNGLRPRMLFPVFSKLIHAGILKSQTGGNNYGYMFNIDPKALPLYEVMTAIQRLPYPVCTLKSHSEDKDCVVCGIITDGLNGISVKLKKVMIYELYELAKREKESDRAKKGLGNRTNRRKF